MSPSQAIVFEPTPAGRTAPIRLARRAWTAWRSLDLVHRLVLVLLLAAAALFLFNSLARVRNFSPDGMNYVDVARNISQGKGITQSALGFNQPYFPVNDDLPTPLTVHPPLYSLVIAGLTFLGIDAADGALVVAALAYGLFLVAAYALTARLRGRAGGLLDVALLVAYAPLVSRACGALTDTLGLLFLLLGLLLLTREGKSPAGRGWAALAAGLSFGLGFTTRYAMAPCLPLGLAAVAVSGGYLRGDRRRVVALQAALLTLGFAIPAVPLVARNVMLTGHALGSPTLLVTYTAYEAAKAAFHSLAGRYFPWGLGERAQELLLGAVLLGAVAGLAWRRRLGTALRSILLADGGYVLTLWVVAYSAFVIYGRTRTFFDVNSRTMLPAAVVLIVFVAGLAATVAGRRPALLGYAALALVGAALVREVGLAAQPPAPTVEQVVAGSERLSWIATQTTDRDLIAGVDTFDVPFYLGRRDVLCFQGLPYGERTSYDTLMTWVGRHRAQYERVFFILPTDDLSPEEREFIHGRFIADLAAGRPEPYPKVRPYVRLADAAVFEVR